MDRTSFLHYYYMHLIVIISWFVLSVEKNSVPKDKLQTIGGDVHRSM